MKKLFLSGVFALATALSFAQTSTQNLERPDFKINYLEQSPQIDGEVINDAVWNSIEPITELIQLKPKIGERVSEDTQVRMAYDDKTLYVSVVCFDSEPNKIVVSDSRRDADLGDSDSFQFIIDTYQDGQNGFLFGTNAEGMEFDAQINNEGVGNMSANRQQGGVIGGTNINWDAAWDVRTIKGDFGWSAEFRIPLRSIRFSAGKDKTWGVNFQRNIAKTSEVAYWASLPLGFDIKRLSIAGSVSGFDLKNPKNLKIMPYGLVQASRDKIENINESSADTGVDVKYSLTPALTLDLTYNTDFAQVEVDEQQVNLDRFNLFFPEKRAFFLENAGQFSVGSPGEVDLFFSRRIGIGSSGEMVPIIGGTRLSGKVGKTNVGLLNMFTDAVGDDIEKNAYSVARVNHEFQGTRSSIGGIFVGRSADGGNDYNRVVALDGKLGFGKKAQLTGFYAKSQTTPLDGLDINENNHAYKLSWTYQWDGWRLNAAYTEVGEDFNPEVGFLQRSSFKKPEFLVFRSIRLKNMGDMMEIRPHIAYRIYSDFENRMQTSFLHIDNHWVWKSGLELHTGYNATGEGVYQPFSISDVEVDAGTYHHGEAQIVFFTNANKPLFYRTYTKIGGYFGGTRITTSNTFKLRMGDKFNSELNLSYNDLNLPNGDVNVVVTGAKLAYSFTPRMFLQTLIQYNNVTEITSVNTRFGWLRDANTGLFVVFNIIRDQDLFNPMNNQIVTVKYTHNFDVFGK
jgi:hypothetical protein